MRPNSYLEVAGVRWEQWGAVCDGEDGWPKQPVGDDHVIWSSRSWPACTGTEVSQAGGRKQQGPLTSPLS